MGYFIELSFDILKSDNFLKTKQLILALAEKNECEFHYNNHEIMGKNRVIFRNHYIMSFLFNENEKLVANFVENIKKVRYVNIESIAYDNCIFKLMYASKKYLNIMDKYKAKEYIENRKNDSLFNKDSIIMKKMRKK